MIQAQMLGRTLEKVYAAALDSALWKDALVAVEDFTGSTGAVVDLIPLDPATRPVTFAGSFSGEDCAEYALNYQSICPRIAFAINHPEIGVHFDHMVLSEVEMDRDPVYEWFGKHGLRYFVAGHAGQTQFYQAYASLQRSRRQGHVDAEDIARFKIIQPHLAHALNIADTLGTLSTHQRFSDALLDSLPQAVFGLANDGVLLFTSDSAERLLARGICLRANGRRLTTADSSQQPEFEQALASTFRNEARNPVARLLIRRSDGGLPYAARISRLSINDALALVRPTVLIIVNVPEACSGIETQGLGELYGLTPCETRLASALLHGHSLQSAAHYLGCSTETVRCHLKSVFRKVGVSRQQDLVRLLSELELSTVSQPEPDSSSDRSQAV
jgi:DNA-binding CsgD family transcriptional regulator